MWALFVVTLLPQIDDAKVTRYSEYESHKSCIVALYKLEKEFKHGEFAICDKVKPVKLQK